MPLRRTTVRAHTRRIRSGAADVRAYTRNRTDAHHYQVGSTLLIRKFAGEPREELRKYLVTEKHEHGGWARSIGKHSGMADGFTNDQIVRVVQLKPSVPIRVYRYRGELGFLVAGIFTKTRDGAEQIREAIRSGDAAHEEQVVSTVLRSGG